MIADGSKSITADKLIEDYICSQNVARFGLKHQTIEGHLKQKFGRMYDSYYWHQYTMTLDEKILQCLSVMSQWKMWDPLPAETKEKYSQIMKKIQTKAQAQAGQGPQMMRGPTE